MALVKCAVCKKQVSEKAVSCPHCGEPDFLSEMACPDCDYIVPKDTSVCSECGNPDIWSKNKSGVVNQAVPAPSVIYQKPYQKEEKSMVVGLLLTFFFGPLGLLYTNIKAGVIMTALTFLLALPTLGLTLFIGWIGSMIWAAVDIDNLSKGKSPLIKDFD